MNEQQDPQGSHGSDGVNEQQDLRPTDQHHSRIASVQLRLMLLLLMMMMMMIQHDPCQWYIRRPYLHTLEICEIFLRDVLRYLFAGTIRKYNMN